jgi:hypothetical protein
MEESLKLMEDKDKLETRTRTPGEKVARLDGN